MAERASRAILRRGRRSARRHRVDLATIVIGAILVAAIGLLQAYRPVFLEKVELIVSDWRMYWGAPTRPTDTVAIAAIDDVSIDRLGRWPWPRSVLAQLVVALSDYKAKAVGLDLILSEPDPLDVEHAAIAARLRAAGWSDDRISRLLGPGNDQALAHAMSAEGATYLGFPFEALHLGDGPAERPVGGFVGTAARPAPLSHIVRRLSRHTPRLLTAHNYLPALPALRGAAAGFAFENIDEDADGVIRAEPMTVRFQNGYRLPLTVALASAWFDRAPRVLTLDEDSVAGVSVGPAEIPTDEIGEMLIRYRKIGTIPIYSVSDIIDHKIAPADLAGKLVLVGLTATGLGDRKSTPVGDDVPGVEIHANALDNIIGGDFVRRSRASSGAAVILSVALGLAVTIAVAGLSAWWSGAVALALAAAYFGAAEYLLLRDGVLVDVVLPMSAMIVPYGALAIYRFARESREKRRLRHAFEKYLHPHVIAAVVDKRDGLKLGGERRHVSILFADIRNYTSRAERTHPEELVALLNTYMTAMTNLILEGHGVVDKLMGDGIMAFWGAPLESANPSRAAIECALKMLAELDALRKRDLRFEDIQIGIGINSGDAIVGNFGGEKRFDYSVIGDTVNTASRIEGLTARFGVQLLVSRKTLDEAGQDYVARDVGLVKVKGREELVPVVEVMGRAGGGVDPAPCRYLAEARRLIASGASDLARAKLRELLELTPRDRVAKMYLDRLQSDGVALDQSRGEMVFEFEGK